MKLRGGAYERPDCATNVSTCSPTCLVLGLQLTVARPAVFAIETPAGSGRLLIAEPEEASAKLRSSPAFTANAVPSRGVGACQRRVSCGPPVVPAPAPTTTTKAVNAARAPSARFRSEERRVGKECRCRWARSP